MKLHEKLDYIITKLDASNVDIAKYGDLDRTNVSRFRNGRRFPWADSDASKKLINGLYLYADNINALDELCSITGGDPDGTAEEIKKSVKEWLYKEISKEQPDISKKARIRTFSLETFSDRFNSVVELTGYSNIRLSQLVNVDSSLISRYRSGLRNPLSNPEIATRILDTLWQNITRNKKTDELAGLMKVPLEDVNEHSFSFWLYDYDSLQDSYSASVEKLMDAFQAFTSATPPAFADSLPDSSELPGEKSIYFGTEGLREAVIRFLLDAARSGTGELKLYSDESMEWMVSDPVFRSKWTRLMQECLKKRIHIRIIHNIDRSFDEMSDAIISWLPLYATGLVQSFYCRKQVGERFSHTLFLNPGKACIAAFHVTCAEDQGIYHYYTDPGILKICEASYDRLLEGSASLVKLTDPSFKTPPSGNLTVIQPTLSVATMPENLVKSFESPTLAEEWKYRHSTLEKCLENHRFHEFLPLADISALDAGVMPIESMPGVSELHYSAKQYRLHIMALIHLLESDTGYRLYLLPETPFKNMKLVIGSDFVKVTSALRPHFSLIFNHPLLYRSFAEYTDALRSQYTIDRNTLRKKLRNLI